MKRALFTSLVIVLVIMASQSAQAQVLSFPEAEGFGRFATGARTNLGAATVYHVTNLNNSGPGSFRDAVSQSNRFVVFDVGGIANISSVIPVASNITIAGQTAPGGFTLYNNRISFTNSHNLVSRHFAVRKGTASGREDTASIARGQNMIFDHMSITWGVDANFDINPDSGFLIDNITIQNSIIGQGLDNVGHSTGGLLQPGDGGRTSVIRTLYTDNVTRNPKARADNEFINNVVYGYETSGYIMGDTSGTSNANVEGNYFIEGPVNGSSPFASGTSSFHIYANDNWVDDNRNGALDGSLNGSYPGADVIATRHAFPTTATMTAQEAVPYIVENAGVSIIRDTVDTRMMTELISYGTLGGVIQRESDLFPGYGSNPVYLNPRARFVDDDNDGIADNWETDHGLDPNNAADWKGLSPAGYTRLEEYLNELGGDGTTITSTGGAWTTPATWAGSVLPTLADAAEVTGSLTHAAGHGFARRLEVDGLLDVTGGTIDVFDTATISGTMTLSGGEVTAGRVLLGSRGQTGAMAIETGGTVQTGTIDTDRSTGSLAINGGTYRATGVPNIVVPTTLGAAGAVIDTTSFSGQISGDVSGPGGITKRGTGTLTLLGNNTHTGPTVIEEGQIVAQNNGLGQTSRVTLGAGTVLDVATVPGGLGLGAGKALEGAGTVLGNVTANAGAVVRPQGDLLAGAQSIGIQAEALTLGSDWQIFNNATHGTGAGGSYNGADLNGGGIVHVANDRSGVAPIATGVASTTVEIPETKTWYLYVKSVEPTVSPIAGDPATHSGGNNSFFAAGASSTLQATTSSFKEVQTIDSVVNVAHWTLVSPTLAPLPGVNGALVDGIDYFLTGGTKPFAVYGREVGTIIDGFVLSDENLTPEQLELALSGATSVGDQRLLTVAGNYSQASGATLEVELAPGQQLNRLLVSGTATLGGDLTVLLADGFTPQTSDEFLIVDAGSLVGEFENATDGNRVPTADLSGSFLVDYDLALDTVSLTDFAAAIPGDFNFDLSVDQADLAWWEIHYGETLSGLDFLVWQRHVAASEVSALTTPEPAAATLLLLAVGISASARRRFAAND